ncbi:hypothetical protein ACFE04_006757 [Oxalis oulophora]
MALTVLVIVLSMFVVGISAGEADSGYGGNGNPKSSPYEQNSDSPYGSSPHGEKSDTAAIEQTAFGVQGVIMCKSGSAYTFLKGAKARITCVGVDEKSGYEKAPFSITTAQTDENGYFLATLTKEQVAKHKIKIKRCKVFLEESTSPTCEIKTDVNKGKSGALLSSYTKLVDNMINLYTVGPFFYTSNFY